MARQTLNNGDSLLSFRTKLNDNFTELYPVFTGTWADLLAGYPAASHSNKLAICIDPTYFSSSLRLRSDGSKWRLEGDHTLWIDTTPMTGAAGTDTSEQLQKQWTAPAGFLTSLRWLSLKRLVYKTATSDTYTDRIRVGAGSTPLTDTQWLTSSAIASANRSNALDTVGFASSATQLRRMGASANTAPQWNNTASGITYPVNTTIPDSDAADTVFSCTMQLTTGTDSSASGQAHLFVSGG
jgi:hypothetical protein